MLYKADEMDAYDRQRIFVLNDAVRDSPRLNETQKRVIERLLQEIVDVWTNKDYM